ncbi:CLUMA_CG013382, isoform A [Clunio marinus]|uniref:CLUMA_CG013382, isoform A n=1 Tax=Clunio marinus TaxID=568069 RepID=A0A1J1IIP2_9DIPT|nr:CLUMA_CG013382, isoform A [Clunio marinus]
MSNSCVDFYFNIGDIEEGNLLSKLRDCNRQEIKSPMTTLKLLFESRQLLILFLGKITLSKGLKAYLYIIFMFIQDYSLGVITLRFL